MCTAITDHNLEKKSEIEVRCLLLPWWGPRSMPHRFTIFLNHLIKILPRYLIGKSCLPRGNVNKATKLLEYCCHVNISNCLLWCNFSILYWYDIGFYAGFLYRWFVFIKCLFFFFELAPIKQFKEQTTFFLERYSQEFFDIGTMK